jgi:hypothetical protein
VGFVTILLPGLILGFVLAALVWGILRILPERLQPSVNSPVDTMVYALLLVFAFAVGLTVSQETSVLAATRAAAATEANSVGELYWYAHALSEPEHSKLQRLLRTYATVVVKQEWPLLGQHKSSPQASAAVRAIREDIFVSNQTRLSRRLSTATSYLRCPTYSRPGAPGWMPPLQVVYPRFLSTA